MIKDLIEKVAKIQKDKEIVYVDFLLDGTRREDSRTMAEGMKDNNDPKQFKYLVERDAEYVTEALAHSLDFDYMTISFTAGVVYNASDLFDNKKPKVGAEPIDDVIYLRAKSIDFYKNGEKVNKNNLYNDMHINEGYINFTNFIKQIDEQGLAYDGPRDFFQLPIALKYNQKPNITIGVDFTKVNEENQEEAKTYKKRTK